MKVIVFTAPNEVPNEFEKLREIARLRPWAIHIRKPHKTATELAPLIEKLDELTAYARIAIHGVEKAKLAERIQITTHLTGEEREKLLPNRLPSTPRSTSAHSLHEVNLFSPHFDYLFLSPIFPSFSKPGYKTHWELPALRIAVARAPCPIFALGGINSTRLNEVKAIGFDGIALLGAIWQAEKWSDALNELKKCVEYE